MSHVDLYVTLICMLVCTVYMESRWTGEHLQLDECFTPICLHVVEERTNVRQKYRGTYTFRYVDHVVRGMCPGHNSIPNQYVYWVLGFWVCPTKERNYFTICRIGASSRVARMMNKR